MDITFNSYDSSAVLKATAEFINKLAELSAENEAANEISGPSSFSVVEAPTPANPDVKIVPLSTDPAPTQDVPASSLGAEVAEMPQATGRELDAAGMPWDERIHSAGKSKIGNGTWKKRRGVDKALVEQVEAELIGAVAPAAEPAAPAQDPSVFANQTPAVEEEGGPLTWPKVLKRVVPKQVDGSYDKIVEQQFFAEHNLEGELPILATRPDLFEAFLEAVRA